MVIILRVHLILWTFILVMFGFAFQASAQVCSGVPGLLVNGGFEDPDITQPTPVPVASYGSLPTVARIYDASNVMGWDTTSSDNRIELWHSGHNNVISYEGNQHAELNAFIPGSLYQDLATTPNTTVVWSFAHRGRSGIDEIEILIGPPSGPMVSQGIFATNNINWDIKTGDYQVPLGQSMTRFQFNAVSSSGGNDSLGNFIDAVNIAPNCDYGDAPASFPVIRANNGAAHRIEIGAFLGSGIDAETDGNSAGGNALGDDTGDTDDEDGVTFGPFLRGSSNAIDIIASTSGYVNIWVDFDQDGNWQNDERIFTDMPVVTGSQSLSYTTPLSALEGSSFARVRFTTDNPGGTLGVGGDWPNGEVEDYTVTVNSLAAQLEASKSMSMFDPLSEGLYSVPGNDVIYTISVSNIGTGATDTGTLFLVDHLPPEVSFFNGDADGSGPETANIIFTSSDPSLTFDPAVNAGFSSSSVAPSNFSNCNYSPVSGYDPMVKFICFNPDGQLSGAGTSAPTFSVSFRAGIQ